VITNSGKRQRREGNLEASATILKMGEMIGNLERLVFTVVHEALLLLITSSHPEKREKHLSYF